MGWEMRIYEQMERGAIDILICRKVAGEKIQYVSNLSGQCGIAVKTIDVGARMEPCMSLNWNDRSFLQAMADGLFEFGIKPKQEPVLQNELTATKYHLEDMRGIVANNYPRLKEKE